MDVKKLLEGHRETKRKLAGVLQEINAFRKRAKKEPEEQAHWASRIRVLTLEARSLKRQTKTEEKKIQMELLRIVSLNERRVLTMRYLDGMTFHEISEATAFSLRSVYRLHSRGFTCLATLENPAHSAQLKPPA